jgi:hypothetical protein
MVLPHHLWFIRLVHHALQGTNTWIHMHCQQERRRRHPSVHLLSALERHKMHLLTMPSMQASHEFLDVFCMNLIPFNSYDTGGAPNGHGHQRSPNR